MDFSRLFDALDLEGDGALSREELNTAAVHLGWHWREAPVFAVLDLLTVPRPIPKKTCIAYLEEMTQDPLGPYGRVLLHASHFSRFKTTKNNFPQQYDPLEMGKGLKRPSGEKPWEILNTVGQDAEKNCDEIAPHLEDMEISVHHGALLIIDPQQSFTEGVWMESIGPQGEEDVKPIHMAFQNCARLLREKKDGQPEIMFTRCPFPPDSYGWNDLLADMIDSRQLYFVKPGNSVLFPPTNGFREWVHRCIGRGKKLLVMGGCTINSCLRVSSIETQNCFRTQGLQVVVDLSLSGARARNFESSSEYGGLSAVVSAVRDMADAEVLVVRNVVWKGGGEPF